MQFRMFPKILSLGTTTLAMLWVAIRFAEAVPREVKAGE
jgi:hypothetical protein